MAGYYVPKNDLDGRETGREGGRTTDGEWGREKEEGEEGERGEGEGEGGRKPVIL